MKLFMTSFAAACGAGAVWHETRRQRRKHWKVTTSIVIEHVEQDSLPPRIEYKIAGVAHIFLSLYGGTNIPSVS